MDNDIQVDLPPIPKSLFFNGLSEQQFDAMCTALHDMLFAFEYLDTDSIKPIEHAISECKDDVVKQHLIEITRLYIGV